jgi:DNA-directed RNA polymerase subunit M/transcription elongation factor TFIIS
MPTTNEQWIELKRTDFLSILKTIKPTLRVKSAPDRNLQIGFENNHLVMSVQGETARKPAKGDWNGIASTKLYYFLTFLVAIPEEPTVRISFLDEKIKVSTAKFKATWAELPGAAISSEQAKHAALPVKEVVLKFKCPKCRRKQGVVLEALTTGLIIPEEFKTLIASAKSAGHGFGCLSCGKTWEEQVID